MMNTPNVLWGILIQKPATLKYLQEKKPWKMAALIVFLFAFFSSILLLVQVDTVFVFLSFIVFGKIVLLYWLFSSIVLNSLLDHYKNKDSLKEILSFLGFLSPLFSVIVVLGTLIWNLPVPPHISFSLLEICLAVYFILICSNGLTKIYKQSRILMVSISFVIILLFSSGFTILRYLGDTL